MALQQPAVLVGTGLQEVVDGQTLAGNAAAGGLLSVCRCAVRPLTNAAVWFVVVMGVHSMHGGSSCPNRRLCCCCCGCCMCVYNAVCRSSLLVYVK
jgi:hypothetical protein